MGILARVITWVVVFSSAACGPQSIAADDARIVAQESRPRIAIIIDDLGYLPIRGDRALRLPGAVSYAILPHTPHSRQLATEAHRLGKEVLLHLPMQSLGHKHSGEGELRDDMDHDLFLTTLDSSLSSVPYISGVNNHMGSRLTQSADHMAWLMQRIAEKPDMYFIDSRTTDQTVAAESAQAQGVPVLSRDVFLDNQQDIEAIRAQFDHLVKTARHNGSAVGIGHPHAETLSVLEDVLPRLDAMGVELVSASQLISRFPIRSVEPWQLSLSPSPRVVKN